MQQIEDRHVATKCGVVLNRDVLLAQVDVAVISTRDGVAAANFQSVDVESGHWL